MEHKDSFIVGIDASNIRHGGGITHLSQILRHTNFGDKKIKKVFVWSNQKTLSCIEDRPWLQKRNHPLLEGSLIKRAIWQMFLLKSSLKRDSCSVLFVLGGRFLLSLPLLFLSLAIVKLKGLSLFQLIALYRLIQTLRNSGRFSFKMNQNLKNSSNLSLEESYKILNLDNKKKISKADVNKAYISIQKKIHPDISPETSRLSSIVNEAKEIVLKDIS